MERVGSDDVCEVVVKGQVSNGIELIILPAVLFIPIYIAIGIKFAFENGSFHLLNKWSDLLDEKKVDGKSMSDFNKDKIKTKTDLSFFVGYFAILLAIVISAYVYFFHCHSENAYEISHFLLSLVFIFSGIYAVFVPYNINRAFTITIESRIAMFQAEVKRDLHECGIEILDISALQEELKKLKKKAKGEENEAKGKENEAKERKRILLLHPKMQRMKITKI